MPRAKTEPNLRHKLTGKAITTMMNSYDDMAKRKEVNLEKARRKFDRMSSLGFKSRVKKVTTYKLNGTRVREYFNQASDPYLIYFHGGGYVVGSLKSHDILCRRLSKFCSFNIIAVDYSLAPEHKFPTQLEEGRKIIEATIKNHGPIVYIGGDSAGGNLAAALSSEYKEVALQVLFYPVVDANLTNPAIKALGTRKNYLTNERLHWFRDQYLPADTSFDNPQVSPIFLKNNTPTFIAVGTRDLLIDDAKQYSKDLKSRGIPHQLVIVPHALHGFMQFPKLFGYRKVLEELNGFLEEKALKESR